MPGAVEGKLAVVWIALRPAHVVVADLVLLPAGQGR